MKYVKAYHSWDLVKIAVLFGAYFITARIGLSLDAVSGFATLVWAPTGIALAAFLVLGYRFWLGIALAAFLVNLVTGAPLFVALGIATGNTLEALLGAYLLKRFVGFHNSLERINDVLGLVVFAAIISTMVSATIGVSSLLLGDVVSPSSYFQTWIAWWMGDMLGALVVAPFLLIWSRRPRAPQPGQFTEALILTGLLLGISSFVFRGFGWIGIASFPFTYVIFPVLILIALRFGQRGSVTATFVVVLIAIWGTIEGLGPFAGQRLSQSLLFLQSFMGITAATFMIMSAAISERKKSEARLQESEVRFRNMADTAPVIIWVAAADGTCVYLSKQWHTFTGQPEKLGLGLGWSNPIHPEHNKTSLKLFTDAHKKRIPFSIEYRLKRKDGQYRWVLHSGLPKLDTDGNFDGYIGTIIDIEDVLYSRKLEKRIVQLTQQRTELVALNKAKDEFIAIASHQLRTPATGVKQFVGMLLEGYSGKLTSKQRSLLERAYESNERQLQVVSDLLRIASVDADNVLLKREPVDLLSLTQDILRETAPTLAMRQQEVTFMHDKGSFIASLDKDKVRMVLENIIDNASKYTFPGKKIEVKLTKRKNNYALSVMDEGVGIAKKDLNKLFKKFSRVDNPLSITGGGTGLGLYWTKKVVDLHGGSITVTSKLEQGSTFTINFPNTRHSSNQSLKGFTYTRLQQKPPS